MAHLAGYRSAMSFSSFDTNIRVASRIGGLTVKHLHQKPAQRTYHHPIAPTMTGTVINFVPCHQTSSWLGEKDERSRSHKTVRLCPREDETCTKLNCIHTIHDGLFLPTESTIFPPLHLFFWPEAVTNKHPVSIYNFHEAYSTELLRILNPKQKKTLYSRSPVLSDVLSGYIRSTVAESRPSTNHNKASQGMPFLNQLTSPSSPQIVVRGGETWDLHAKRPIIMRRGSVLHSAFSSSSFFRVSDLVEQIHRG
jgi:hypothetical protein